MAEDCGGVADEVGGCAVRVELGTGGRGGTGVAGVGRGAPRQQTVFSLASSWWSVASTNTAVLPMPDLAWQITSMPRMA